MYEIALFESWMVGDQLIFWSKMQQQKLKLKNIYILLVLEEAWTLFHMDRGSLKLSVKTSTVP